MIPDRASIERALIPLEAEGRLPEYGDRAVPTPRRASVLIPIEEADDGPRLLLTVRRGHLKTHAGQVSFPGGREDPEDDGPVGTALRETEEETGITPSFVEVAGLLERYHTITGYLMTPVVGFLRPGFELRRQPEEVAEIFWMPLERALDPERYSRHSVIYRGRRRHFLSQDFDGRAVWGATAAILAGLGERLRNAPEEARDDAV